jgi:alpha-glucuronidase
MRQFRPGLLYGPRVVARGRTRLISLRLTSARREGHMRLLNHWDNLDRSVERGYAGRSIWDWWALPDIRAALWTTRANASLGINGTVLRTWNAKVGSSPRPAKADGWPMRFRPYGIKVYLSVILRR